ncbi:PREDICTED: carbonic anhydrase 1-like isoform X2 [Papilio xuthus]|uniref:Carbonic anhydrase 1-like isoform X2 n=1 Tax=Papilio xuthus TaxID=66420 RepID=A0AAJ6ZES0_PAPXU|nr:PREDICTED: carbonic anhydrase 1-like isoform X2 [Papilio xuthus]
MVFNESVLCKVMWLLLLIQVSDTYVDKIKDTYLVKYIQEDSKDQTTSRPNTLYDDADDLQKQLDNEARDKLKPKTIWVFHLPTPFPDITYLVTSRRPRSASHQDKATSKNNTKTEPVDVTADWDYKNQNDWGKTFPDCGGRSQSPVDLPLQGFVKAKGGRRLLFTNYDLYPEKITVQNDGKRVVLFGEWDRNRMPLVYGGAAHSRRYIFHSLSFVWPSEHTIGGLQFPMESQALHISAEYGSMKEALDAAPSDPQAFLGIVNIYKFEDHTQKGLREVLRVLRRQSTFNVSATVHPLSYFVPRFKDYASYQGSLTAPPCTESVLWLVRARSLPVQREAITAAQKLRSPYGDTQSFAVRITQPLNDRKIFLFH